jgi:hypothetical protein
MNHKIFRRVGGRSEGTDQARFLHNSKMFEDHLTADRQLRASVEALAADG